MPELSYILLHTTYIVKLGNTIPKYVEQTLNNTWTVYFKMLLIIVRLTTQQ